MQQGDGGRVEARERRGGPLVAHRCGLGGAAAAAEAQLRRRGRRRRRRRREEGRGDNDEGRLARGALPAVALFLVVAFLFLRRAFPFAARGPSQGRAL